jgi:hypothetical protein
MYRHSTSKWVAGLTSLGKPATGTHSSMALCPGHKSVKNHVNIRVDLLKNRSLASWSCLWSSLLGSCNRVPETDWVSSGNQKSKLHVWMDHTPSRLKNNPSCPFHFQGLQQCSHGSLVTPVSACVSPYSHCVRTAVIGLGAIGSQCDPF